MTSLFIMTSKNPIKAKSDPREDSKEDAVAGSVIDQVSIDESSRVRRKIDLILLPLLGGCYFLQFLDKQTLSYASLMGMLQDTHLVGSRFSWTASIFYFGYIFWSYPTAWLSVRLPIGKYIGATVYVFLKTCHSGSINRLES